ncbi:MAG: ATP-dependent helicase HrpB [Gemmatimonadetes bacterium]|nr:ATP-dependent helicase HrpB [Gemmatimonadota bacterium]
MPLPGPPLPIDEALPALHAALAARTAAVVVAPPGAGKTTRVPLALLDAPWLAGRKVLMLEPRRLAARAAAHRMAHTLGERTGQTVGYRVRGDTSVGARTRIEVVTEGILTRLLLDDPTLDGVGAVLFDEYHERSLVADTGLALALETQAAVREELRLVVMSATLDGAAVAALLGDAPVIASQGRMFPVAVSYHAPRDGERVEAHASRAVRAALAETEGDVLCFLPGAGEIRRVAENLASGALAANVTVHPLHGTMAPGAQDAAIAPSPAGERKVVLATTIAETSLTIEGVRVVIDAGLVRVPRFSPRTGMTRLETVRVSKASAEQRRGRAGRVAPGACRRLWPEHEHAALLDRLPPEITQADLAPLALDLAAAGVQDPATLRWLDAPSPARFTQARALLAELGAFDAAGRLTAHGRAMSALPLHPRLAHLLLAARARGLGAIACDLAALLADRDVLRPLGAGPGPAEADVRLRLEAIARGPGAAGLAPHALAVDHGALARVREEAGQLRRALGIARQDGRESATFDATHDAGLLLALAYPERIARRRDGGAPRYVMRGGQGAVLAGAQSLAASEWLAIAEVDGQAQEARIYLAAPMTDADVRTIAGDAIVTEDEVTWDAAAGRVRAKRTERLGAITLASHPLKADDPALVARALVAHVRSHGLDALAWRDGARTWQQRAAFARTLDPTIPDVSDAALLASLDQWLLPALEERPRADALATLDVGAAITALLGWQGRAAVEKLAPSHLEMTTGSRVPVDYADPAAPGVSVRVQELFGLADTPTVGAGRVRVVLTLLSPAHRPVQVTRDLGAFWRTSYAEVRKDMRGRYPRHPWPEDPLAAEPTRRAKPRGT